MTYRGHVKNGQITLDEPAKLPEGVAVAVQIIDTETPHSKPASHKRLRRIRPLEMPGESLADELIRDRR